MRTTCIVNNYNYQSYLVDAVESALNQTQKFDEIIIVDDGSTDGSWEIITKRWGSEERVKTVLKSNGGQLSAFNAGFTASVGDLICFLDSDDIYRLDYLEKTLAFYRENPDCNFGMCGYEKFGEVDETVIPYAGSLDLGISAILVNQRRVFLGGPTSTLSLKRTLAEKILPFPYEDEWRSRADDVLIFGSSLVGAHKFSHPNVLVRYRVHTANAWYGKSFPAATRLKRELAINRLFAHFRSAMGYGSDLCDLAYLEFRTHPTPDFALARDYLAVVSRGVSSLPKRFKYYAKILAHYFATKKRSEKGRTGRS